MTTQPQTLDGLLALAERATPDHKMTTTAWWNLHHALSPEVVAALVRAVQAGQAMRKAQTIGDQCLTDVAFDAAIAALDAAMRGKG